METNRTSTRALIASAIAALPLLGLTLGGCVKASLDSGGIGLKISFSEEPKPTPETKGGISCDLRIIQVSDGSVAASATGEAGADKLADLSKALAKKLKEGMMVKGYSVAVVSLRNRSGTPNGKVVADEIADKVAGALLETGWFDVKERIDLREVLNEKDLESAEIVRNPNVQPKLAGVRCVVIGGVTVSEGPASH